MADWPLLAELKQVLDVTSTDWDGDTGAEADTRLTALLAAAIDHVKEDVAGTVEAFDEDPGEPTTKQARAALSMDELMALKPEVIAGVTRDPTYDRLLKGSRRSFGVA
jgi:hypothetical protein